MVYETYTICLQWVWFVFLKFDIQNIADIYIILYNFIIKKLLINDLTYLFIMYNFKVFKFINIFF